MNNCRRGIVLFTNIILLSSIAAWAEPNSQTLKSPNAHKKLLVWGGLDWYSPEILSSQIRKFEELPFDGTILSGFKVSRSGTTFDWRCFGKEQFEREDLAQTIETLKGIDFKRFTDNFSRYNVSPGDVDWFDDFSPILHNAGLWAQITKETGMKGWFFDIEDYQGRVFAYKKMKYAKEKSFEEYARQARLRGKQFIEAINKSYPEIVIVLTQANSFMCSIPNDRMAEQDYGLLPAFVNGMIEGGGPKVRIVDGQEQAYRYLTAEDYLRGYHSIRQQALAIVPPELWGKYREKIDAAVAVFVNFQLAAYDKSAQFPSFYMTPQDRNRLFETNIYNALNTSDEYVWVYSEGMSWWQTGAANPTPDGAIDAIRSARNKIHRGEPLGFDITPSLAAAQSKLNERLSRPWPAIRAVLPRIESKMALIDGLLDDAAWKNVPILEPFVPFETSKVIKTQIATRAQAAFDDENLYIAFRCDEPEPNKLIIAGKKKDDDVWRGDCVDVLLTAADGAFIHLIVNPANVQWDDKGTKGGMPKWNAQWQSGAKVGAKEWTAEIAIPWQMIGGRPMSGSVRANLCRHRAATAEEYTTWSPMFASNMEPEHLGIWELTK